MIDRILDTVVSVVTPNGKSGVGVIRISGNLAFYIAFCILKKNPKIRFAEHCFFWLDDDLLIDIGVSVFFKSPNSFTGEDVLELYSHGNVIILESLVKRSIELGARLALNGEFSFRAFFNNKIDLLQAESINQLINSNYIFNNKAILNSLNGIFSNEINLIIDMLLSLRKKIEACIDFVEDFHICVDSLYCEFYNIVDVFMNLYSKVYRNYSSNNNFKVVIFGNVNVGKSSLFNLLLGENRSIVSDIPGTTRDFITSFFCHYGSVFDLVDTAGLNESIVDFIEAEGIKKTFEQINFSDVLIYVIDISSGFNKTDDSFFLRFSKMFSEKVRVFVVYNKIDVLGITEKVVIKDNYV
ncbi:MAG: GTPase, partial [Enterobacteriaceae bacterium]|nr:GTPase [Enterobacteriaceae bacterium]